jgi:RNA polymerase sigma-70 factor (ECF subfamily)
MSQSEPSDADDVRRTLTGDREAFARLFDRHARLVRAVVVAVSGDFGSVEDLTQETFLRAYRGLGSLHDINKFRVWIQGIARTVAREQRRHFARESLRIETSDVGLVADVPTSDALQHDEEQRLVMSAMAELPDRERLAVHAYFFHEQNADEAAAAMGISRSGFYAALDRGVNHLRQRLGGALRPSANTRNEK